MKALFFAILYQPFFNIFVVLYRLIPDVGVTIVLMTILLRVILYPFTSSSIKAQKSIADIQPKLNEIKEKYKGNQQKIAEETMKVYKENKVNPLGSCLPLIAQLFISIALYYVLRDGLTTTDFSALYPFVKSPGSINTVTAGFVDLSKNGNIVLALLAGGAQYWQARMNIMKRPPKEAGKGAKDEDMTAIMNKQMLYMLPVLTVVAGFNFPAGLALYWLVSTLLTGLQQKFIFRQKTAIVSTTENK